MKIKTQDLTGPALDWAVIFTEHGKYEWNNPRHVAYFKEIRGRHALHRQAHYSTDWSHGGPIIEREKLDITYCGAAGWAALGLRNAKQGPTPLIAAMRCFVASKLGDEVEVPDELSKET